MTPFHFENASYPFFYGANSTLNEVTESLYTGGGRGEGGARGREKRAEGGRRGRGGEKNNERSGRETILVDGGNGGRKR